MGPTRAIAIPALLLATPAWPQGEPKTIEELASEEEMASVRESIGCEAEVIEEGGDLYEADDATCEIGRYDIKLDGEFEIISMTAD